MKRQKQTAASRLIDITEKGQSLRLG